MTENKQVHKHLQKDFFIGDEHVSLAWVIDKTEGYMIELTTINSETGLQDRFTFSFGKRDSKEDISYGWGEYLDFRLREAGSDLSALADEIGGIDCRYPECRDYNVIERVVYDHMYESAFYKHEEEDNDAPRMVIVVGPGGMQNIVSDVDMQIHVINTDTEDVERIETGPIYGQEAFIEENVSVLSSEEAVNRYIGGIQIAKKIHGIRNKQPERVNAFVGAAYMMPLYDGLNAGEIHELLTYLTDVEEMVPIEIYENNTAILGFESETVHDSEEIKDALRAIAEDWNLHPDDNVVVTKSGLRIALLERIRPEENA